MAQNKSNDEILDILKRQRLKTFYDLKEDTSNLKDILEPYQDMLPIARKLVSVRGKYVEEVLTTHGSEYQFFDECRWSIKMLLDYFTELLKHERGLEYQKILNSSAKVINDSAIKSLIDAKPNILQRTHQLLMIRDLYQRYNGILESYQQRAYQLNNYTRHTEYGTLRTIL
jgi:hypothetical protein